MAALKRTTLSTTAGSPVSGREANSDKPCFEDLIGVEFKYGGRGPKSYDCWGLVQECYSRWHNISLPDYRSTDDPEKNALVMQQEGQRLWKKASGINPGTVILIRVGKFGAHVGFAHERTRFLHALEGFGVLQTRVSQYQRQILGAYEYVGS